MKVPAVILLLVGSTLCSLEPASYRGPSSHSYNQYLAPTPDHHQHRRHRQGSSFSSSSNSAPSTGLSAPSRNYVPPHQSDHHSYDEHRDGGLPELVDARRAPLPSTSYGVPDYNTRSGAGRRTAGYSKGYQHARQHQHQEVHNAPAKYDFGYQVRDNRGNDFGHKESRDGELTRGTYFVLLPDGRRQVVEYEADEAGYRPKITYEPAQRRTETDGYHTRQQQQSRDREAYPYPGAPY